MPITIKTGAMKYRKSNGEYDGFNAIAQESTDQQIASIQTAGAAQVNAVQTTGAAQVSAVQQKGAETLDSIPDDYTELAGDVSSLKSALVNLSDGNQDAMLHAKYYDGYYNATPEYTGNGTEGKTAVWGVVVIPVPVGEKITISGFRAQGGTNSCWLNSNDPDDVKQVAWASVSNNGTKTCVTGWLGISDYNLVGNTNTITVNYAIASDIRNDIANNKTDFDNYVYISERDEYTETDNCFSNRASDWLQGARPGITATYATYIDKKISILDKTIYIWSKTADSYAGSIVLYFYNDNDEYINSLSYNFNTLYERSKSQLVSGASYFYISVSSGDSSIERTPKDVVKNVMAYIGYSPVKSINNYYPKYVSNYAGALYKNDDYVNAYKFGDFDTSENLYSNNPADWSVPAWNATLAYKPEVAKGTKYISFVDKSTIPSELQNGAITIQQLDSSNTVVATSYHSLTNSGAYIYRIDMRDNTAKLNIYFNTGSSSVPVTADMIKRLRFFLGAEKYYSTLLHNYIDPSHYIPKESRNIMDGGYLPDYWLKYLKEKAIEINNKNDIIGENGFSFAFVTDEHLPNNYWKSPLILRWLKEHTMVDRFVNGGDLINEHSSIQDAMSYIYNWRNLTKQLKMRSVRGNHDDNSMQTNTDYFLGNGRYYANLIRMIEDSVTVEDGNLYYYEKVEAQKVCIFYLDTGDMIRTSLIDFDAQITWMSQIVETLDSDWSILVIQHIIYDGVDENDNPVMYSTGTKTKQFLDSVSNCNVIGMIGGHTHRDYSETSSAGYPIIVTTCDAAGAQATTTRTEGTVSEQAMDVFHVCTDPDNRKIYATRIGYGTDRDWSY